MKETPIQSAICDYLALKRYFFWRQNTAPTFDKAGGFYRAMPKHSKKGVPDIIVIKAGQFIGIEVKTEKGKLSPEQVEFGSDCILNGGMYLVARSIDDVQAAGL